MVRIFAAARSNVEENRCHIHGERLEYLLLSQREREGARERERERERKRVHRERERERRERERAQRCPSRMLHITRRVCSASSNAEMRTGEINCAAFWASSRTF